MNTDPTTKTSRTRRALLAALVAGALTGGFAAGPASAAPAGPDDLGIEIDPCATHGDCGGGWEPPIDCDETPQLCDLTTPTPNPGEPTPEPEDPTPDVDGSDVVKVNPRFTG